MDQRIYELHVRDFSANDPSVPAERGGKYSAFTHADTYGMRHLRPGPRRATDIRLLPVFDFATVPETGCTTCPDRRRACDCRWPRNQARDGANRPDLKLQLGLRAAAPCNAPEGSYATNAADPAVRARTTQTTSACAAQVCRWAWMWSTTTPARRGSMRTGAGPHQPATTSA